MPAPISRLTDAVLDPELADGLVRTAERHSANHLGMGEEGRIEIEADPDGIGPRDPVLELRDA